MANEKYALLDTDFISKMHLIRKDDHNKLIDKIMAMPGYCFYCHKQIQVEIMRHNIAGAPEWFQSKIESKSICMYDDEMILDELSGVYGEWAISAYAGMLKTACDAYKDGYFEEKFVLVSQMDCRSISREDFLKQLIKLSKISALKGRMNPGLKPRKPALLRSRLSRGKPKVERL